ncbi:hypothetical protein C8R14_1841, partial [Nitrosomonas eutropha]
CGRTVSAYSTPACSLFTWPSWPFYSKDFEQVLTPKEWKLQGKVGTGILGLADVGIEITFGP